MGFKLGFALGFGAGFLTGSRSGREPYDRVSEKVKEFREREEVDRLLRDAQSTVSEAKEKVVERVRGDGGNGDGSAAERAQDQAPAGLTSPGGYQPGPSTTGGTAATG